MSLSTVSRTTRLIAVGLMTAVVAACSDGPDSASTAATAPAPTVTTGVGEPTDTIDVTSTDAPSPSPVTDVSGALPVRDGPREQTTESVPHIQLDAEPVPEVDAELRRRAFAMPGVEDAPSEISLPGARGLVFGDDVELARPDVLLSGREFAHIHADGSLHVWLPVERAVEVDETGWGEMHPWVDRDNFWDGVAMVFTPRTLDEVDIVIGLLADSYNLVSGRDLDPTDIP